MSAADVQREARPTADQQLAADILVAYVRAVVKAQDTEDLVQGGLDELGVTDEVSVTDLAILVDSARLTITVEWEETP